MKPVPRRQFRRRTKINEKVPYDGPNQRAGCRNDEQDQCALNHALADRVRGNHYTGEVVKDLWIGAPSELRSKPLMNVFRTLLKASKDRRVLGQVAWLMALSESPAAVPSLVKKLPHVKDAHAFREMHRALNALTYAYIEVDLHWNFDFDDLERVKATWAEWYETNRSDFRRYEEKKEKN